MELLSESVVSDNENTKVKWPTVWVKPKTGVSTESFIQTNKPKALVFGPSRANGGYTAMTIKRALAKFGESLQDFVHFGDAIPSQAVFLSESNKSKTTATPGKVNNDVKAEYVARMSDFVRFIMDTGCGFDFIDAATARLFPKAMKDVRPMDIHTANGPTECNKALKVHIDPLNETASALVLPDTPWVLSIGLRCQELGYGFHWFPYQTP